MRVPVLTYHAMNIGGNAYADNDHVALAEDLALIARSGLRVVPLAHVVDVLLGEADHDLSRAVAITFDDGSWFDWHDMEHPTHGLQRGFASILREHGARATSFVIASPGAREALDRTCMIGRGWWTDDWWAQAGAEGVIAIESHSFDHVHDSIGLSGRFDRVADYASADREIRQAADCIDALCAPHRTTLFAYPYGHTNDYLVREYLPRFGAEHRVRAAFTTEPKPVETTSERFALPRYVCGRDWRSPDGLAQLL